MDANEKKRFTWIKNVYGDWEEHAFMIAQVELAQAEVEQLKAENERLKANQELWGSIELITAQRKEKEQLRNVLKGARDMIERHGGDATFIKEALKDSPK